MFAFHAFVSMGNQNFMALSERQGHALTYLHSTSGIGAVRCEGFGLSNLRA